MILAVGGTSNPWLWLDGQTPATTWQFSANVFAKLDSSVPKLTLQSATTPVNIVADGSVPSITINGASSAYIRTSLSDLPSGAQAYFQECEVCVSGVTKYAYFLMTTPTSSP